MPKAWASASKAVEVAEVSLTFDIVDENNRSSKWREATRKVWFVGRLTKNGEPWPGEEVEIWFKYVEGDVTWVNMVAKGTTDSEGNYRIEWTVPWKLTVWKYPDYSESKTIKLPCGHYGLWAYHRNSGVYTAGKDFYVAYPTRISISAPDAVAVDYPFTVEGKLEYCDEDTWKPLAGATVYVYYNGSEFGSGKTDSEGKYSVSGRISSPGTYTLTARYPGEGLPGQAGLRLSAGGMGAGLAVMLLALLA